VLLRFCAKTDCPAGLLHAVESQLHMAEHTLGAAPKERRHGGAIVGDVLACRCGSRQYRLRPTARSGPSRRLNNAVPDVPRRARCQVRDRDTRIGIALQGAQAGRLWRLLGERLVDEEKTAPYEKSTAPETEGTALISKIAIVGPPRWARVGYRSRSCTAG
jgi:hypothetical protein